MSVELSKGKFAAILVAAAVACAIVGIACWYGKPVPPEASATSGPVVVSPTSGDFPEGTAPWLNLYLPRYTIPKHYDLTLYPNFYGDNAYFDGNVTIEIDVRQATWHLLVHIKDLNVQVTSVKNKETAEEYGVDREWGYEPNQFWIMKTKILIPESSTVLLTIKFSGSLTNGIVGLYKAFYANNTKAMATSKFEPVDARKAFPCFDEPNLKATFTIWLVHKPEFTALSNMPEDSDVPWGNGLRKTKFQKSVPMSTYLACFIVCDCRHQEATLKSGKKFRVYAVEGSEDQVEYALQLGVNVTDYFEDYFGLEYPLPKMDMIAIPDFVSGAMEHWGLITYRETNLLYKEGVSSPSNKQRIAEVVAHELAHQWFGNIVTMDWWDDLWLNEGFATFMSYVGVEPFQPEMEVFRQFASIEIFTVMPEDSKASSHPIIVPVKRPEDITAVFDSISYNKGASVIRMLEEIVGRDNFKRGLAAYLKRYQYENAKTYQLWTSLAQVASFDVESMMDTWTKQSGYPLVTVSHSADGREVTARQQLYKDAKDNAKWPTSPYNYKWNIPLRFVSNADVTGPDLHWLYMNASTVTFPTPVDLTVDTKWLKINKGTTGYYRVNYPTGWWNKFSTLLKNNVSMMDAGDRGGLVNDAMSLARYGHMTYSTALNFISYMTVEEHYVPWVSASSQLFDLRNMLGNSAWKTFVQELILNVYNKLAWKNGGSHLDKLLRGSITRLACGHEYTQCLDSAKDKFTQWLADPNNNPLDVTVRRDVLVYGMMSVTPEEWDRVWSLYVAEPVASAKADLRRGLAQTNDSALIQRYLDYAMDKQKVADQDFFSVIAYLASNRVAFPTVWQFVQDHYESLKERFGLDNRYFGRMVPGIVSHFTDGAGLKQAQDFFAKYPDAGSGKRAREQALEDIQMVIQWKKDYANEVNQWLENRS